MINENKYLYFKRGFDFFFSIILLFFTAPILIIIALAIKIEDSNGPVLFKQKRIGQNNIEFNLYKFRSMIVATEKNGNRLTDLDRMLKIGHFIRKLSFDELPQIFNILKGQMSFIGPRPLPSTYLPYYTEKEIHRHDVKPGISGWAQVNGRNFLDWDQKFNFDLYYVNHCNFLIDLKIFFLTMKKVFLKSDTGTRGVEFPDVSLHETRNRRP